MKDYYIFKSGRINRKDNSIFINTSTENIPIPINDIDSLYIFGEVDLNTKAINFFAQNGIVIHFFNYYGWYTGSFYPKEQLLSGELTVRQVEHYLKIEKRLFLAKQFVKSAMHGFTNNLKRYKSLCEKFIFDIEKYEQSIDEQNNIAALMGIEGNARDKYYESFPLITQQKFKFDKRVKHPPDNAMNALISFVNSLVYTAIIKEIYKTQLNPTISYLHEPSARRFSLALDISEIFKPLYGDRIIFDLINNNIIGEEHFDSDLNYCCLKENGKRIVVKSFDDKLNTTIHHRKLNRKVSYRQIIRFELYKLIKHLLDEEIYKPFLIWW